MTCTLQIVAKDCPLKKSSLKLIMCDLTERFALQNQTLRIVDAEESQYLNKTYRHIDKPTNVLSFPGTNDLVLCHPVIQQEALAQHKPLENHYTHLIIHGTLHLLGYDHETETDAAEMESLEIDLLKHFNIPNPYEEHHHGT